MVHQSHISLLLQPFSHCDLEQLTGHSDGFVLSLVTFNLVFKVSNHWRHRMMAKTGEESQLFLAGWRFGPCHRVVLNNVAICHLYEGPLLVHFNKLSNDLMLMCIKFSDLSYNYTCLEYRHQGLHLLLLHFQILTFGSPVVSQTTIQNTVFEHCRWPNVCFPHSKQKLPPRLNTTQSAWPTQNKPWIHNWQLPPRLDWR